MNKDIKDKIREDIVKILFDNSEDAEIEEILQDKVKEVEKK